MEYIGRSEPFWTDEEQEQKDIIESEELVQIHESGYEKVPAPEKKKYNETVEEYIEFVQNRLLRCFVVDDSFEDHSERREWRQMMEKKHDWFSEFPWNRNQRRLNFINELNMELHILNSGINKEDHPERFELIEKTIQTLSTSNTKAVFELGDRQRTDVEAKKWLDVAFIILEILAATEEELADLKEIIESPDF